MVIYFLFSISSSYILKLALSVPLNLLSCYPLSFLFNIFTYSTKHRTLQSITLPSTTVNSNVFFCLSPTILLMHLPICVHTPALLSIFISHGACTCTPCQSLHVSMPSLSSHFVQVFLLNRKLNLLNLYPAQRVFNDL